MINAWGDGHPNCPGKIIIYCMFVSKFHTYPMDTYTYYVPIKIKKFFLKRSCFLTSLTLHLYSWFFFHFTAMTWLQALLSSHLDSYENFLPSLISIFDLLTFLCSKCFSHFPLSLGLISLSFLLSNFFLAVGTLYFHHSRVLRFRSSSLRSSGMAGREQRWCFCRWPIQRAILL